MKYPVHSRFGPISDIILQEWEEDAALLMGCHADTIAVMSTAILEAPKGERGLRDFLRHLRACCGTRGRQLSDYIEGFKSTAAKEAAARAHAEARLLAVELELNQTRNTLANERAQWTAGFRKLESEFAQERDVRIGLAKLAAQRGEFMEKAGAELSTWASKRVEWAQDQADLQSATQRLALGAVESNRLISENHRLGTELMETQKRLAHVQQQHANLNDSLSVGASWLGGSLTAFTTIRQHRQLHNCLGCRM